MSAAQAEAVGPVLTKLQRRDRTARVLAAAARTRSPSRREHLIDYAIRINMVVARDIAGRYWGRGVDPDDLTQVAYTALIRATASFRPELHYDFLSFAVPTIRGEVKKYFRDLAWTIRPPRRIQDAQPRITLAESELANRLGRFPEACEVAAHLGLEIAEVHEASSASGCFHASSLEHPLSDVRGPGTFTLADVLGEDDVAQSAVEARVALAPIVRTMPARDQRILYLRFFEDRTQQEIADEIGVTQMQVSRLLARILGELRSRLCSTESGQDAVLANQTN